jgi:hypothetical protein
MFINDPDKQAQFEQDLANENVPQWNPNDQEAASAYVNYFNNLMNETVCELIPITTYKFEFFQPGTREKR